MIDDRHTVLAHFGLRFADLDERLASARAAEFEAIGLWTEAFAEAERAGLDAATQRALVDRAGLAVTEIEAVRPFASDDPGRLLHRLPDQSSGAGDGEFDLVGFIRLLDDMDVSVPVSLEAISSELQGRPADEAATAIHQGFRRVLASAASRGDSA